MQKIFLDHENYEQELPEYGGQRKIGSDFHVLTGEGGVEMQRTYCSTWTQMSFLGSALSFELEYNSGK